jgi:preprotein translocase subunit YajC
MQLIPLLLIVVLFVFMNRQQRKRTHSQQTLVSSLQPGELVVTTSGLYGTVRTTDVDTVSLEIADQVVVRFAKGAIARKTQGLVPEVPQ